MSAIDQTMPDTRGRRVLVAASAVATVVLAAVMLPRVDVSRVTVPIDFLAFWAAGKLNADGANPYDPVAVRAVQTDTGYDHKTAVIMWNPPWLLAATMPLGQIPVRVAFLLWMVLNTVLVVVAADLLWRGFGGPDRLRWVGWGLAVTFAPTTFIISSGQVTVPCLLGLGGFVAASRAGRPGLAGAAAALTAIKPHLLALFGLALLLDAITTRFGRRAVLAGGAVVAAATLAAMAANPAVVAQYVGAATAPGSADHQGLADWVHPTPGSYLRSAVAPESFAVQLVPLAVGAAAAVVVWWRRGRAWDWPGSVPGLVVGSLLVAPYGAWSYDLVLLLVPVLAVAARLAADPAVPAAAQRVAVGWYSALTGGLFLCLLYAGIVVERHFVVVTPFVAVGMAAVAAAARGSVVPARVPA
jgi:hypothetical protein